jgi:hypothetical protein
MGHLLATAVANLAQASFGPLEPFQGLPALQPLLDALEVIMTHYCKAAVMKGPACLS